MSAIDVDIYANLVDRAEQQDELEHIIIELRKTRETVNTMPSTHHAFCRYFLSIGERAKLVSMLADPIKYGMFADDYIYNLLLDECLEAGDIENGVQVARLMMLQEESGTPITRTLASSILTKYLASGQMSPAKAVEIKEDEKAKKKAKEEEEAAVDEDEIEYVRIPIITNPYFDDHFDITNPAHFWGKSMTFFGKQIVSVDNEPTLGYSMQVIGMVFHEKFDKLNKLLDKQLPESCKLTEEPLAVVQQFLQVEALEPEIKAQIEPLVDRLKAITGSEQMSKLAEARLARVPSLEEPDKSALVELYQKFVDDRQQTLTAHLERLQHEQRRQELEAKRRELEAKQRHYYFFENFPRHQIDFVEAEKRINELKSKTVVEENYVPPEF